MVASGKSALLQKPCDGLSALFAAVSSNAWLARVISCAYGGLTIAPFSIAPLYSVEGTVERFEARLGSLDIGLDTAAFGTNIGEDQPRKARIGSFREFDPVFMPCRTSSSEAGRTFQSQNSFQPLPWRRRSCAIRIHTWP